MNISKEHITRFYFLGIGGIGMSALARYFNASGYDVAGYDKTATALTTQLISEGIEVNFAPTADAIPARFKEKNETMIVYTPAVPADMEQYMFFLNNGFGIRKRAQVLGMISHAIKTLAIAGTHGKTTTTAILGHLLAFAEEKVTAFLGGISENYHTNLILKGNDLMVVEADEFDRSFLTLSPSIAAITSMDADHLDIYGEADALTKSFGEFAQLVQDDGELIIRKGLPLDGKTYGIDEDADYNGTNLVIKEGVYEFNLQTPYGVLEQLRFSLPGKHNVLNAIAAMAVAIEYGISPSTISVALPFFKGVERRFSYRIKTEDLVLIDDYAHHPTEINAVHQAIREMYPDEQILAIFQPHLYSRTRDFINEFASALGQFDQVALLDIYPAREKPIAGITSMALLHKMDHKDKKLVQKEELKDVVSDSDCKIVVMMGAGDIGIEIMNLTKTLQNEVH
ncbi:UDP-N-acetylmuramate--L-alanine ligase [Gangjinia marincola]|uniref:UDP-N-acetylmuramate--L-alanine ligase n=1 Tax=Gangjinia marincola TaxID=578463 RepID=A0ABP3XXJ6_9FLAO